MLSDLMMLMLYGALFATVMVTFLRWGGANDALEAGEAWAARGVPCTPQPEVAPSSTNARTSWYEADIEVAVDESVEAPVYAKAN